MDDETVQISALAHAFAPGIPLAHIARVFCDSNGDVRKAWIVLEKELMSKGNEIDLTNATLVDIDDEVHIGEIRDEAMLLRHKEFMNSMFGDDKNTQVISDILENCNYDIHQTMERLINLCQDNPARDEVHHEVGHRELSTEDHLNTMKQYYEKVVHAFMENDDKEVNNFLEQGKDYMVQLSAGNIIIPTQDRKLELKLDVRGMSQPAINLKLLKDRLKKLNNEENDCLKVVFGTDDSRFKSASKEKKVRNLVSLQSYTIEDGIPGEIIIRKK